MLKKIKNLLMSYLKLKKNKREALMNGNLKKDLFIEQKALDDLLFESYFLSKTYKFKQDIPKSPNQLKLSKWFSLEIEEVCEQIDLIEQKHKISCTCKKGCSNCCKQLIAVCFSECLAIKQNIENLDNFKKEKLKQSVLNQCEILENQGITNKKFNSCNKQQEEACVEYFKLNMPCVFLDENNSCSIYNVRPCTCWSYRNYGDPSLCEERFDVKSSLVYDSFRDIVISRVKEAKPRKENKDYYILPFAIKKMMNW